MCRFLILLALQNRLLLCQLWEMKRFVDVYCSLTYGLRVERARKYEATSVHAGNGRYICWIQLSLHTLMEFRPKECAIVGDLGVLISQHCSGHWKQYGADRTPGFVTHES